MPPRRYFYNLDASSSLETPVKCLNDGFLEDDSGYKGHDSTPRYYKKRSVRKTKLSFTPHLSAVKEKASTFINSEDFNKILLAVVPYIVTMIFISSIFFTIYIGNTDKGGNMKYESLKYGVENALARGLEIKDPETGELLGGKRAAIQYHYSVKYGDEGGKP